MNVNNLGWLVRHFVSELVQPVKSLLEIDLSCLELLYIEPELVLFHIELIEPVVCSFLPNSYPFLVWGKPDVLRFSYVDNVFPVWCPSWALLTFVVSELFIPLLPSWVLPSLQVRQLSVDRPQVDLRDLNLLLAETINPLIEIDLSHLELGDRDIHEAHFFLQVK